MGKSHRPAACRRSAVNTTADTQRGLAWIPEDWAEVGAPAQLNQIGICDLVLALSFAGVAADTVRRKAVDPHTHGIEKI